VPARAAVCTAAAAPESAVTVVEGRRVGCVGDLLASEDVGSERSAAPGSAMRRTWSATASASRSEASACELRTGLR
jgi:hypothetical protein